MSELGSLNSLREAVVNMAATPSGAKVLRFFFDLPLEDAWALLPALSDTPTRVAAWHSEEDGNFVAGGVAWEATFQGPERFQDREGHQR